MAIKHIDLEDIYIPKTKDMDIIVNVRIGDAGNMVGAYSIFNGTKFISANSPANLGTAEDVENTRTTITVVIPDILNQTNWTSMTVLVNEGAENQIAFGPYKAELEEHLDTAVFTLKLLHP